VKAKLLIIANNNIGSGQSGGDTIFLEFIKHWQKYLDITVFGCQEAKQLLKRYQLKTKFVETDVINTRCFPSLPNLIIHFFRRIFRGLQAYNKHKKIFLEADYCYTISDFTPDFIFGLLYKSINPKGLWLCGQYLFAPKPGDKFSPYRHHPAKGWLYYLFQIPTQYLCKKYADQVLITSEPDRIRFPGKKVHVVQGGVDISESKKYLKSKNTIPFSKRKYDAVFQGRLHFQKGVLELVEIWNLVVKKRPNALLALIGDGQLEAELKAKIKKYHLEKNIILFGFRSGQDKFNIFKESKLVVHPAIYDSGGMAAAEAMAWGLPGVSFNLEALKTYYPIGMLKTTPGNFKQFANNILRLLEDKKLYKKTSSDALQLITTVWDWSKRANNLYTQIFND
jgi:glycosyltransferase involved in cell wall biosynthesis